MEARKIFVLKDDPQPELLHVSVRVNCLGDLHLEFNGKTIVYLDSRTLLLQLTPLAKMLGISILDPQHKDKEGK